MAAGALAICVVLAACVEVLTGRPPALIQLLLWKDVAPENMAELKRLCEKDGGVRIHETVGEEVEGVICEENSRGSCFDLLTDYGYSFIEQEVPRGSPYGLGRTAGIYRNSLRPLGHPECPQLPANYRPLYPMNYCITWQKVDGFAAKYRYFASDGLNDPRYQTETRGRDVFYREHTYIKSIDGRLIAESHFYSVSSLDGPRGEETNCFDLGHGRISFQPWEVLRPTYPPIFFTIRDIYGYRILSRNRKIPAEVLAKIETMFREKTSDQGKP